MLSRSGQKIAVVLFNLGGPDNLRAVRPFLFNLFNDRAIINIPQPFRFFLAKLISVRREPVARKIYEKIGGRSPLLENTKTQAKALEKNLKKLGEVKCFIAMRYWHPFAKETAEAVRAFDPDKIILLPLYPQFSTTTAGSSLADWNKAAARAGLRAKTASLCCFPQNSAFIKAHISLLKPHLKKILAKGPTRLLFTAHGLPEKIVAGGDPYAWQVGQTVQGIMAGLEGDKDFKGQNLDHVVCYQSRIGPLKWLAPSTESEIIRAGREGKNLVMVPIAFVSEHSETLVELDMNYQDLAKAHKIKHTARVPALGDSRLFIQALTGLVEDAFGKAGVISTPEKKICPRGFSKCPCGEG